MRHDFLKQVLAITKEKQAAVIAINSQLDKDWGPTEVLLEQNPLTEGKYWLTWSKYCS